MSDALKRPKVVLFIAHFGDGHRQVASALRREYERAGAEVMEVDCLRAAHPRYSKLTEWTFEFLTQRAPLIYGWSHEWTRKLPNDSWFWKTLSSGPHKTAHQVIESERPDIALQLFPEHTLTGLHRLPYRPPVTGVVLTDYSIHSRWFCPEVDVYYLPHESLCTEAKRFLSRRGGNPNTNTRFVASGIPIREQFCLPVGEKNETRDTRQPIHSVRESGRPSHIVVATGGRGVFPDLDETLQELLNASKERIVYVLCGRNEAMYQEVRDLAQKIDEQNVASRADSAGRAPLRAGVRLQPLSFIEDVATLLRGAAYAVVKAGGVTVTECLSTGCPMLFYRPALGQERDNALWVEQFGAGRIVHDTRGIASAARDLETSHVLDRMRERAYALSHENSARAIVLDTLQSLIDRRSIE